jgi:hypothetical protein
MTVHLGAKDILFSILIWIGIAALMFFVLRREYRLARARLSGWWKSHTSPSKPGP